MAVFLNIFIQFPQVMDGMNTILIEVFYHIIHYLLLSGVLIVWHDDDWRLMP